MYLYTHATCNNDKWGRRGYQYESWGYIDEGRDFGRAGERTGKEERGAITF